MIFDHCLPNAHNPEVGMKGDRYTSRYSEKRIVVSVIIELLIKNNAEQKEKKNSTLGGFENTFGEHGSLNDEGDVSKPGVGGGE